jgi:hypothetical protein
MSTEVNIEERKALGMVSFGNALCAPPKTFTDAEKRIALQALGAVRATATRRKDAVMERYAYLEKIICDQPLTRFVIEQAECGAAAGAYQAIIEACETFARVYEG